MACRRFVWFSAVALLPYAPFVASQGSTPLPSSFPHAYPGQPSGDFSPAWQKYFQVTTKLPNVTFPIARSFAGNLPVQRAGHPNNTLFFLGFEQSTGSLTAPLSPSNQEPWGIWLNGGHNGPIRINGDYSASPNKYSWNKLADYFWIDQPVGVGYSTADADGYAPDEDQIGKDFMGFLGNLVKVFPSLATRPLHITGESYAGQYIPYILKAYFDMPNPPVKVEKIAIGDGTYSSEQIFELLPALSVLETYPQIIGYDQDVYNYFKLQTDLCGFNITLTYPQHGIIPDVNFTFPTERFIPWKERLSRKSFMKELTRRTAEESKSIALRKREAREAERELYKRDLSLRANGTIDPWYGCFLLDMFIDYAINYTFPWNLTDNPGFSFNVYDIPDALNPKVTMDASVFMNDSRVRAAFHAPTSKDWAMSFDFPFGASKSINIFNALAANATAREVGIVLFSGNDDSLIPHRGTEVAIQNTTFGGVQGFTRKPSTPWNNDAGQLAGVVHQERGWSYVLFLGAGHLVAQGAPVSAFTFLREFVLGKNKAGLVTTSSSGAVSVVGGENQALSGIIPGPDPIYYGNGATQSTYIFPSATRAAWKTFIAGQQAQPTALLETNSTNDAPSTLRYSRFFVLLAAAVSFWLQL
ncbi:Alpha/Beta hydrolase protein [Flammula alnicola]|nr:Alpha/Beta hydrolase protein [Flammula alnicola]